MIKPREEETPYSSGSIFTEEHKKAYEEDGVLIVRGILDQEYLQPLRDELAAKVEAAIRDAVEEKQLDPSQTFDEADFASRFALASAACEDPLWMWNQHFYDQKPKTPGLFTLRTAPVLLDIVEALVGSEILAHPQYAVRAKLPDHETTVVPWHQDIGYLNPEEAGDTLIVNFWTPLVQATEDNGCMQVMRGTHRMGVFPHRNLRDTGKIDKGIADEDLPDADIINCEVEPGDVVMLNERCIHRSLPNTTKTVRWSVDTRYCAIGLPTGRDRTPGFVARSRSRPESVATSCEDWKQLLKS